MERDLGKEIMEVRECHRNGNTKPISWRRSQLQALKTFLLHYEVQISRALNLDLGKHYVEAFRDEVGRNPTQTLLVPIPIDNETILGAFNRSHSCRKCCRFKTIRDGPACSSLLANTLPKYLDNQAIKVIEGGPAVGQHLLQQKWDKIFFTGFQNFKSVELMVGSANVGRMIMSEAAKNLTPVTLELGGKCPAILDSLSWSWDTEVAIKRIVGAKYGSCAGQACISIDYVLVERSFSSTTVELLKAIISTMYGDNPRESHSVARIVNKHHFLRLKNILTDQVFIVYGGSTDEDSLYIETTILADPPLESAIMTEEVFGPLLPIITVRNIETLRKEDIYRLISSSSSLQGAVPFHLLKNQGLFWQLNRIEDGIDFINSRPKPLAIYAFTKNEVLRKRIVSETSSGSVVFNDAIIRFAVDTIPFWGIGESGMGKYHGKFSFDTFTHYKAVVRRSFLTDFWYRFPPWNNHKMELLEDSFGYDYFGLLLVILGLKKSRKAFHVLAVIRRWWKSYSNNKAVAVTEKEVVVIYSSKVMGVKEMVAVVTCNSTEMMAVVTYNSKEVAVVMVTCKCREVAVVMVTCKCREVVEREMREEVIYSSMVVKG
ncbi:Copper/zinc superoxide dismutase 1 [Hibiscus syriacus]|uniref:Copper/zinc superoxide dismutase 1 n=1 Tax=Hibiscus syriacus TaxID=106335 RepID=A0A6A3AAT6_HIBSY|nr:Copper/zinc superoxide dismutase 1 [Hibiscus syriacus]